MKVHCLLMAMPFTTDPKQKKHKLTKKFKIMYRSLYTLDTRITEKP